MIRRSTYCQRLMNPHPGISPAPILGYCSASPAVERQPVPTKALSSRGSVRHPQHHSAVHPDLSCPRPTNSVRRNLERPLQHCRMNPLPGIWDEPATVPGYCYASPNGDNNLGSRPTANYSLLTANSFFTFSAKEAPPTI